MILCDFSSTYFHPFSWRYIILSHLKQTEILKHFIILYAWCISFASFTCWQFLRKQNQWVNLLWPQLCTQSLCVGHGVVECSWDVVHFHDFPVLQCFTFFLQGCRWFMRGLNWGALRWSEMVSECFRWVEIFCFAIFCRHVWSKDHVFLCFPLNISH